MVLTIHWTAAVASGSGFSSRVASEFCQNRPGSEKYQTLLRFFIACACALYLVLDLSFCNDLSASEIYPPNLFMLNICSFCHFTSFTTKIGQIWHAQIEHMYKDNIVLERTLDLKSVAVNFGALWLPTKKGTWNKLSSI